MVRDQTYFLIGQRLGDVETSGVLLPVDRPGRRVQQLDVVSEDRRLDLSHQSLGGDLDLLAADDLDLLHLGVFRLQADLHDLKVWPSGPVLRLELQQSLLDLERTELHRDCDASISELETRRDKV